MKLQRVSTEVAISHELPLEAVVDTLRHERATNQPVMLLPVRTSLGGPLFTNFLKISMVGYSL